MTNPVLAASTDTMWTCCKTCARDTPTYCLNGGWDENQWWWWWWWWWWLPIFHATHDVSKQTWIKKNWCCQHFMCINTYITSCCCCRLLWVCICSKNIYNNDLELSGGWGDQIGFSARQSLPASVLKSFICCIMARCTLLHLNCNKTIQGFFSVFLVSLLKLSL
jgi:hypothetical protein